MSRKALAAGSLHRPAASALRLTNSFSTRMAESLRNLAVGCRKCELRGECESSHGYNPPPRSEPSGRGGLAESPGMSGDAAVRRGKSGLQRTGWWVTPTGREIRESATENKPPRGVLREVRVKRCGKSAPAGRVTGLARQTPPEARPSREQVESHELRFATLDAARFVPDDSRVGCLRRRAIVVLEE